MKKFINGSLLIACQVILVACSGGNCNNNVAPPTKPSGPISYVYVHKNFVPQVGNMLQSSNNNGCGSVMGQTSAGLIAVSGFFTLIPEAGPAIGATVNSVGSVLALMGTSAGNNCNTIEFNDLQSQLSNQQQQINNLESNLNLSNNQIWQEMTVQSTEILNTNYVAYNGDVSLISGNQGLLYSFMYKSGLWNPNNGQPIPGVTIQSLLNSPESYNGLYYYINSYTTLDSTITNIASVYPNSSTSNNLYNTIISQTQQSYYWNLLSSFNNNLSTQITAALGSSPTTNIVPYIDQYNQSLSALYQKSLYSINEAYIVSYLINMINFQNYSNPIHKPYLADISGIHGVYYNPNDIGSDYESQLDYYNTAQRNLTDLYAQIVNQLYTNTLAFVVTDAPVGSQSYPNKQGFIYINESGESVVTNESINYSQLVGSSVANATTMLINSIGNSNASNGNSLKNSLNNVVNNSTGYQTLFYQVPYLSNIMRCNSELEQYNQLNGVNGSIQQFYNSQAGLASCQPILLNNNGESVINSIMNWNTIQPYYVSSTITLPTMFGSVTNNIAASNPNSVGNIPPYALYIYTPTNSTASLGAVGTPYLMSGNWNTAYVPEQNITNTDMQSWNNVITYMPNKWYTYASAVSKINPGGVTGNITYMSGSQINWASNGTSNVNLSYGANARYIYYGWMDKNYPAQAQPWNTVYNNAVIQTTFQDGFIASFVVSMSNVDQGEGGYYANIFANPALSSVLIDGNNMIAPNSVPNACLFWNPTSKWICSGAITVNNNTLLIGGTSAPEIGDWGDVFIYQNPTSCHVGKFNTYDGGAAQYGIENVICSN